MSEHKHTEGPWSIGEIEDIEEGGIEVWTDGQNHGCIAKVVVAMEGEEEDGNPILMGNARLIAAAPDLLEALQELVACKRMKEQIAIQQELVIETDEEMEEMGRIMSDYARRQPKAWENASQIIAKATGEQE